MPPRGSGQFDSRHQHHHYYHHHHHHQASSSDLQTSHIQSQQFQQQQQPLQQQQQHHHHHASSATSPSSSSSSSLSHAFTMHHTQRHNDNLRFNSSFSLVRQQNQSQSQSSSNSIPVAVASVAAKSSSSSANTSSTGHLWSPPSTLEPPVTDEELQALLASRPWKSSEVEMDESFEEMLSSSLSTPSWQPASSQQDTVWTQSRQQHTPYEAHIESSKGREMDWDSMQSRSPLLSEPSISPSSFTYSFPPTIAQSNFLDALSDEQQGSHHYTSMLNIAQTPNNFASPLLAPDPLSSPEDDLFRSLHHHQQQQQQQQQQHDVFAAPSIPHQGNHSIPPQQTNKQRPMRRQYTSSSLSSNSSNRSSIGGAGEASTQSGSATTSQVQLSSLNNRPRAGTFASNTSYSVEARPSSSTSTMDKIQEMAVMNYNTRETGISTSLSAELAGLGLNVADFAMNPSSSSHHDIHDSSTDGVMEAAEMQRNNSSSSSSTTRTRRAHEQAESSFLSQATSSLESSGLDDSLLSLGSNPRNSSRWVHGKDTPPSSPAPSFGYRSRPSQLTDQRVGKISAAASLRLSSSSPYSRPDEFGSMNRSPIGSSDWSGTWPRTSKADFSSSTSPLYSSHSHSSQGMPGSLSPSSNDASSRGAPPSSYHDRRYKRHSRAYSSQEAINDRTRFNRRSNESLQSDIGPSRSSRLSAEILESRRTKRMSASFVSEQGARQIHQERQSQYDQVSDALDTLRRFLRQREGGTPSSTHSSRPTSFASSSAGDRNIPSLGEQVSVMLSESSMAKQASSRRKTLRHPPTGPLPPRGSIYTSSPNASSLSPSIHESTRVEAERIAALEDLAMRVRQMKDDNQRLLDDL